MSDQGSIVLFTKAAMMLAEANTIQKCQELKSLALTASDWARHKKAGAEAVSFANSYAIRAEIKMGEMLKATERAKGAQGTGSNQHEVRLPDVTAPTLADLGVTKRESSEAQFLASLPENVQELVIAGDMTKQQAKRELKAQTPQPAPVPAPKPVQAGPTPTAEPLPAGPDDKDARIAQLERLIAERDATIAEMKDEIKELASGLQDTIEDNESMARIIAKEDRLTTMMDELNRFKEQARVNKSRNNGLMSENSDLIGRLKSALRKIDRLEKKAETVGAA